MTIEDSLNKIEINQDSINLSQIPSQDNPSTQSTDNTAKDIFTKYIYALDSQYKDKGQKTPFNPDKVALFADRMKFKEGCVPVIEPMSKLEVLEIMKQEDSEIYELVTQTDFEEYIPRFFNPTQDSLTIQGIFNLNKILYTEDLKQFGNSSNIFVMPNFAFASLFIEEEKMLKKYLRIMGDTNKNLAVMKNSSDNFGDASYITYADPLPDFLSAKSLLQFHRKTGEKQIRKMFEETKQVIKLFEDAVRYSVKDWQVKNLRSELFNRLKKYHPELTC
ncbi:hypothetical protein HZA97_09245 [Candidatus Woesearchaeota archaeon]|nr:hypothetical protein [Candidatus Woesearchaeota archaeon]